MRSSQLKRGRVGAALVAMIAVVGAAAIGAAGEAQPPGPRGGLGGPARPGPGGPFAGLGLNLRDLSEEQREQAQRVVESHAEEMERSATELRTSRFALEDAIATTPLDEAAILQRSADVGAAEGRLAVVRGRIQAEIFALLTPDQQQQVTERREQMRERREAGEPRPPRRPGARLWRMWRGMASLVLRTAGRNDPS